MYGSTVEGLRSLLVRPTAALRGASGVVAAYLVSWLALDLAAENIRGTLDVSVWYPPAGLSVALLLVFGIRYAPAVAFALFTHLLLFRDGLGYPLALLLGIPVAYAMVYAGATVLLVRGMGVDPRLARARDVVRFVAVYCLAAPLLANAAAVAGYALGGFLPWSSFLANTLGSWAGEATGIGVLAPILLLALRRYPGLWTAVPGRSQDQFDIEGYRRPDRREVPELVGQAALLALTAFAAYGGTRGTSLDYAYLVFVPLIWVAVRWGFARTTVAVLFVNTVAVAFVGVTASGPNPILLQFGLTTLTLVGLLLGALVSERRLTAERLIREASHDRLTGLPNRAAFFDLLVRRSRRAESFAVFEVDLDGFGAVNSTLGHQAGDEVLVEVADRVAGFAGGKDRAARLAGDRFALLVEDVGTTEVAARLAGELSEELSRPYEARGREVRLTAGVGAALRGSGAVEEAAPQDPEELLHEADTALEKAKKGGRSRYVAYDRDLGEEVSTRLQTETDLGRALERGEFVLRYQPVCSVDTREVLGAEALVRWRHPDRGLVGPAGFIALAEQTGQIAPLGKWVLREALLEARTWERTRRPWVSVNVSARQVQHPDFAGEVGKMLEESGLPPELLRLELTESAWTEEVEAVRSALEHLAGAGVVVAVDDFGTGYSPISNLKDLSVGVVKIDRSFVAGLPLDRNDGAIVGAISAMARGMGLEVVAEGVETEEQLEFLKEIGCGGAQGFLLGRPMPAEDFARLLGEPAPPGEG